MHHADPTATSPAVELRPALVPIAEPQQVHLHVGEHRETEGAAGLFVHELDLDLAGTLVKEPAQQKGAVLAKLRFNRIQLRISMLKPQNQTMTYDSSKDRRGTGNPLADLMSVVAEAELSLLIETTGCLRELHGLDALWRAADLLMAPPGLLTAQWTFRDAAMRELISETLFPGFPSERVRTGDDWVTCVPANIPLQARLDASLQNKVTKVTAGEGRAAIVRIDATGTIVPAAEIIKGIEPAILAKVKSGTQKLAQEVRPGSGEFAQASERTMDVVLTLKPPSGNEQRQMVIRQHRTLAAERGRMQPVELKTP